MAVRLVGDFRLRQQHQVVVAKLHSPYCLGNAKAPDLLDVVHSEVEPWGTGRPVPR